MIFLFRQGDKIISHKIEDFRLISLKQLYEIVKNLELKKIQLESKRLILMKDVVS